MEEGLIDWFIRLQGWPDLMEEGLIDWFIRLQGWPDLMEDGFPLLEEFQDEHTLERQLESLLDDASHHLPVRKRIKKSTIYLLSFKSLKYLCS